MNMSRLPVCLAMLSAAVLQVPGTCGKADVNDLRLVPFPKQISMASGRFSIGTHMVITLNDGVAANQAAGDLKRVIEQTPGVSCDVKTVQAPGTGAPWTLTLGAKDTAHRWSIDALPAQAEGYSLLVRKGFASAGARSEAGLVWGIQALRQLVFANMDGNSIPCLSIADYPSLKLRGFQDDITRGPSTKLDGLKHEVEMSSLLRMNFFTYYMEYQFAYKKHPDIGPKDGSLTPDELKSLIEYAKPRNVEVIGCQQSFGHLTDILKLDAYKHLRETDFIVNPTDEGTYKLLDDLYSEQAPLTESKLFNICCDETYGLGTGPSKSLADKIGVGGVYVNHLKRVHDILKDKYGKRMMMWGDIILQYPERLNDIPKDTVMLSWGYEPLPSFESVVIPFEKSGYDFLICPGVNCWSRILPNFGAAVVNIHNYVRDGVKHNAMGMLNTVWRDDSECLFGPNWHGLAWGAECAWSGSTTSAEDFNRRVGAVLFGEKGDHFGKAIALLSKASSMPGYDGMMNRRFWAADLSALTTGRVDAIAQSKALLDVVNPALEHLYALRKEARANTDALDEVIFGAERMKLIATRTIDFISASECYEKANDLLATRMDPMPYLEKARDTVTRIRNQHAQMKRRFVALWLKANKPYALDWNTPKYDTLIAKYDKVIDGLQSAGAVLESSGTLPPASDIGIRIAELGVRSSRPAKVYAKPLDAGVAWTQPAYAKRVGITISGNGIVRTDQPVLVDLPVDVPAGAPSQLVEVIGDTQIPVASQIEKPNRLVFIALGTTSDQAVRRYHLYYGAKGKTARESGEGVKCTPAQGGNYWIENDAVRLFVGREGAHIYRWEVKDLNNRDLTEPGDTDWQGFADMGQSGFRNSKSRLEVVASGPVRASLKCTDPSGLVKTIDFWAGASWADITLNSPTSWFWCYDDVNIMGASSSTPGSFLFQNGDTGKLRPSTNAPDCQEARGGVNWSAKYVEDGPLLGLLTPEVASTHKVGPGSGMGGVGIEFSQPAAHFVIYGGKCSKNPAATLESLCRTLSFRTPPAVEVYATETK